jgi:rubrerythrin
MRGEAIVGELTARQMKLLDLFKGAIEREREAQEAYREMLPFNDDLDIKRIIEGFVRQEKHHEETLLTLYSTLRTPGGEFSDPA